MLPAAYFARCGRPAISPRGGLRNVDNHPGFLFPIDIGPLRN